ncbi:beta-glucoside-specific PTS transporter subunit IIABC [Konateibacter massiliensis]|uniref:beta-glucoside-specific PTS transporter subunit IIABC n=1 Tax=Konateibacter massiliensis TaxID=2002841 RepID=UPI000C1554C2|nr:beta-glucoside-specific PTS transporter subunit IIABC [Konateibacter massiliensis]
MKYEQEAKTIVSLVGGEKNVNNLLHCATRLRFELKNESKVDKEELKKLPYVMQVVQSGGQCQIVVGPAVADYYDAILKVSNISSDIKADGQKEDSDKKKINLDMILKVISGAFSPLIPLLAGAGMVKALLTVLATAGVMSDAGSTYAIISAAGNSVFYFMPLFLGYTLAKQFGANPYVGAAIGAALLEPSFTALIDVEGTTFLGINVTAINYSATIFPIFIAMMVYALLEKGLKKIIRQELQLFLVPMLSLMIMVPFTAIVFGPFGTTVGNAVSAVVSWLFELNGTLAGVILGATYPYLTILGLHWGFTPITLQNLELYGGDVIEGVAVCAVYAQIGIAIGAYLKGKKGSKIKGIAGPNVLTGVLAGVTEPILYGIVMEYKRLFAVVAIAAGIGGAINGTFGVTCDAYVFHNIFSASMMTYSPFGFFVIGILASLVVGALLTYFWGIREEDMGDFEAAAEIVEKEAALGVKMVDIQAPADGKIISLEKVDDEVFASGVTGKGLAIDPDGNIIKAPCEGEVTVVFPSKHALGITTADGVELLIHVGLNTVMLDGQGFENLVEKGDKVKAGQPIIKFDRELIQEQGYSLVSPVIITNADDVKDIIIEDKTTVTCGDVMYQVMV